MPDQVMNKFSTGAFYRYINKAKLRANQILRCFHSKDRDILSKAFVVYDQSLNTVHVSIWSPCIAVIDINRNLCSVTSLRDSRAYTLCNIINVYAGVYHSLWSNSSNKPITLTSGVPQGSSFGPARTPNVQPISFPLPTLVQYHVCRRHTQSYITVYI